MALEQMAAEAQTSDVADEELQRAIWHRWCADQLVERKDQAPITSFYGHPYRNRVQVGTATRASQGS